LSISFLHEEEELMLGKTDPLRLVDRLVKYCVGLTFVGAVSAVIAYALHGWTWPSRINGVSLTLPEFVAVVVSITLVIGVCVDYWKTKHLAR
jgi:hypothetical protein